jgi:hypothetical protein
MTGHRLGGQATSAVEPDPIRVQIAATAMPRLAGRAADTGISDTPRPGVSRRAPRRPAFNFVLVSGHNRRSSGDAKITLSAKIVSRLRIAAYFFRFLDHIRSFQMVLAM